jgi:hypothetical protein
MERSLRNTDSYIRRGKTARHPFVFADWPVGRRPFSQVGIPSISAVIPKAAPRPTFGQIPSWDGSNILMARALSQHVALDSMRPHRRLARLLLFRDRRPDAKARLCEVPSRAVNSVLHSGPVLADPFPTGVPETVGLSSKRLQHLSQPPCWVPHPFSEPSFRLMPLRPAFPDPPRHPRIGEEARFPPAFARPVSWG